VTRSEQAQRRLGWRVTAWMAGFLILFFATTALIEALRPGPVGTGALLMLPLVPLAGALWSTLAHHRRNADELEQRIELQSVTLTVGVVLLAATFWGFLVRYLALPAFPLEFSMPLVIALWLPVRLLVMRSYR
jgi:hypothetical protein